jgi:hypothetical protein
VTHERVEITADIPDDETTANIVSSYTSTLQRMLAEEAGPVASPLDGRFQVLPLLTSVHAACHRACMHTNRTWTGLPSSSTKQLRERVYLHAA